MGIEGFIWKMLEGLNASPADMIIILMGFIFSAIVFFIISGIKKNYEKLWSEYKELNHKYTQLNTLCYGLALNAQKVTGVKLIKQSADGGGDYVLNRDLNV